MNWLKKDCEQYREMISALLDDELSVRDKARLRNHLAHCDDCSALCVAFAAADGALGQTIEDVPVSLHRRIMTNVQEQARGRRTRRFQRYLKPTLITAACLAVVAAAVFTMQPMFMMGRNGNASGASGSSSGAAPAAAQGAMNGGDANTSAGGVLDEPMDIGLEGLESPEVAVPPPGITPEEKSADTSGGTQFGPYPAPQGTRGSVESAGDSPMDPDATPAPEPEPEAEKIMMILELEVSAVEGMDDGSFKAVVLNDSSTLLPPGVRVTVRGPGASARMEEDMEAENGAEEIPAQSPALQPGDRVMVRYNNLSAIPEGWLVAADSVELIE